MSNLPDYDFTDLSLNITSAVVSKNVTKKVSSKREKWKDEENNVRIKQRKHERSFEKRTHVNHQQPQSEKDGNEPKSHGWVSSLFGKNPAIPSFASRAIKPKSEPVFSSSEFKELPLHSFTVSNLDQNLGLKKLTTVQQKAIPVLLSGNDALIRSQTGSGKTLAYAVPIIEQLQSVRPKISRSDGIKAVVVVPTRELALQTYELFVKIVKPFTWIVPGYLTGGEKRKAEKARLRKGITILIGTPGRLLDHIKNTQSLVLNYVKWLVLDEADRLLDLGYEKDIASFMETLKSHKDGGPYQTVLLSATLTNAVERLAGLTLDTPTFVDAGGEEVDETLVIPDSLEQYYVLTPAKLRLVTLSAVVRWKCQNSKMIIFLATQDMVDFHTRLLEYGLSEIQFFKLHGNMTQSERMHMFKEFRAAESGVLLSTDVAARGLDLPQVNCIVQYTGPTSPEDYVHRVGRTARVGSKGDAILFLTPSEIAFLRQLEDHRIRLQEETMDRCLQKLRKASSSMNVEEVATALQSKYEEAVVNEPSLHELATKAFVSWSRFYASHRKEMKKAFNIREVHLGHYAKSFALRDPPSKIGEIGRIKGQQNRERRQQQQMQRKRLRTGASTLHHSDVSEFSSGLEPMRKKKK